MNFNDPLSWWYIAAIYAGATLFFIIAIVEYSVDRSGAASLVVGYFLLAGAIYEHKLKQKSER